MNRVSPNAMTIDEYRNIKEVLKTTPINKKTAEQLGRGTTTLATIKKSKSFKNYKELRRKNRGGKKKTVKEVNAEPTPITVKSASRRKKIEVKTEPPILPEGSTVVVPAALFEALSDQMSELHEQLVQFNKVNGSPVVIHSGEAQFIPTGVGGEPEPVKVPTFKERFYEKVSQIRKRWGIK